MITLACDFLDAQSFLDAYREAPRAGGLFVACDPGPTMQGLLGEQVVLDVHFPELGERVSARAVIAWRRLSFQRPGARSGVGVHFLRSERGVRDRLLAAAHDAVASGHRSDRARRPAQPARRRPQRSPSATELDYGRLSLIGR